jgi:hypothetical protein
MADLNIFDKFGFVRVDLTDEEVATVSKSEQKILFALLEAHLEVKGTEEATITSEANKRKAQTALDRAKAAYALAKPRWTDLDEWRKTVARLPQAPPDPAVEKKVASALKVVEAAEAYFAECVAAIAPAVNARHEARKVYEQRLAAWQKLDTRPKDVGDLIRARSKVEIAQKMENLANGLPIDGPVEPITHHRWPIEIAAANRPRGGRSGPLRSATARRNV